MSFVIRQLRFVLRLLWTDFNCDRIHLSLLSSSSVKICRDLITIKTLALHETE